MFIFLPCCFSEMTPHSFSPQFVPSQPATLTSSTQLSFKRHARTFAYTPWPTPFQFHFEFFKLYFRIQLKPHEFLPYSSRFHLPRIEFLSKSPFDKCTSCFVYTATISFYLFFLLLPTYSGRIFPIYIKYV